MAVDLCAGISVRDIADVSGSARPGSTRAPVHHAG
jgi:hypothetical protein